MKNFPVEDEDIEAYQLSTKVFDMLGFEKSYVQKFQSKYKPGDANYDDDLENIEYDMLYGQRYMYPDGWPYEPTNMKYGISKIVISEIKRACMCHRLMKKRISRQMMVPGTVRVLRSHSL